MTPTYEHRSRRSRRAVRPKGYAAQLTRSEFYGWGGFAEPGLFRKMRSGRWTYWRA